MFNLFLAGARIPAKFKAGLIARIPKDGPSNLVENARPITMLNTDYKIYTKMISTRLDPILKEIIHDECNVLCKEIQESLRARAQYG